MSDDILIPFVLARLFQALMDAIAFRKGNAKLGFLWHLVHYPFYGALLFCGYNGYILFHSDYNFWSLFFIIGLVILASWVFFEHALWLLRKIPWEKYPWA